MFDSKRLANYSRVFLLLPLFPMLLTPGAMAQGTWVSKAPLPAHRFEHGVVEVNGKIYVIGGFDENGTVTDTLWAFDPVSDSWATKAPLLQPQASRGAVAINGIIYMTGGRQGLSSTATVQAYNPATDTWSFRTPMPFAREGHAVGVINGILYAAGGCTDNNCGGYVATLQSYDPNTDSWSTLAPMASARHHQQAGVVNSILYVAGGAVGPCSALATVEAYDPQSDTWMTKASMLQRRHIPAVGSLGGLVYALGGEDCPSGNFNLTSGEAYQPVSDSWSAIPLMPTPRGYFGAAAVNGALYAMGGGVTGVANEAFYPATSNQNPVANAGPDRTILLGELLQFDGSTSQDPDGSIVSLAWDFGDNTSGTGAVLIHHYSIPGPYTVTLTVTDNLGAMATDSALVTVQSASQALLTLSQTVQNLNLAQGITNSLDAKLTNALDALSAANAGSRQDATNKLLAFISTVEAQRGKKITTAQADALLQLANRIIAVI